VLLEGKLGEYDDWGKNDGKLKGKNKLVKKKHEKNCFEIGMMRKGKGK
jgi:hypothetical protein